MPLVILNFTHLKDAVNGVVEPLPYVHGMVEVFGNESYCFVHLPGKEYDLVGAESNKLVHLIYAENIKVVEPEVIPEGVWFVLFAFITNAATIEIEHPLYLRDFFDQIVAERVYIDKLHEFFDGKVENRPTPEHVVNLATLSARNKLAMKQDEQAADVARTSMIALIRTINEELGDWSTRFMLLADRKKGQIGKDDIKQLPAVIQPRKQHAIVAALDAAGAPVGDAKRAKVAEEQEDSSILDEKRLNAMTDYLSLFIGEVCGKLEREMSSAYISVPKAPQLDSQETIAVYHLSLRPVFKAAINKTNVYINRLSGGQVHFYITLDKFQHVFNQELYVLLAELCACYIEEAELKNRRRNPGSHFTNSRSRGEATIVMDQLVQHMSERGLMDKKLLRGGGNVASLPVYRRY